MHRELNPADFEGKTIQKVDFRAVNIIRFWFTDGTAVAIEAETHEMVQCDVCVENSEGADGEGSDETGFHDYAEGWDPREGP